MNVLGVRVKMSKKGRPTVLAVTLSGSPSSPVLGKTFEITSPKDELTTLLHDLARALRSHLSEARPDRVVIRRADVGTASRKEGPKVRLLAEGALAAAAREEVKDVLLLTGKALADRSSENSKADLDKTAEALTSSTMREPAAAALAGLEP